MKRKASDDISVALASLSTSASSIANSLMVMNVDLRKIRQLMCATVSVPVGTGFTLQEFQARYQLTYMNASRQLKRLLSTGAIVIIGIRDTSGRPTVYELAEKAEGIFL